MFSDEIPLLIDPMERSNPAKGGQSGLQKDTKLEKSQRPCVVSIQSLCSNIGPKHVDRSASLLVWMDLVPLSWIMTRVVH
jgi:hypothetical protein